jgi:hypothetical protein
VVNKEVYLFTSLARNHEPVCLPFKRLATSSLKCPNHRLETVGVPRDRVANLLQSVRPIDSPTCYDEGEPQVMVVLVGFTVHGGNALRDTVLFAFNVAELVIAENRIVRPGRQQSGVVLTANGLPFRDEEVEKLLLGFLL